jgi:myosin heavy subunit
LTIFRRPNGCGAFFLCYFELFYICFRHKRGYVENRILWRWIFVVLRCIINFKPELFKDIPAVNDVISAETQMKADVDALVASSMETRELYREVCGLLFFRYGIAPTANKLYSLVHRGTMSTPAEVLKRFWEELREKSRLRIERADVPAALLSSAGELVAGLWRQASDAALETLEAERADIRAARVDVDKEVKSLSAEVQRTEEALAHRTENLLAMQTRYQERDEELTAARQSQETMAARISELEAEGRALRQAQAEEQKRFSERLEEMATNAQRTEERAGAAERRALLEIDRERTNAARLQKEIDAQHTQAAKATEQSVARESALRSQLDAARQRLAALDAELVLFREARTALEGDVVRLREDMVGLKVRAAAAEALAEAAAHRADLPPEEHSTRQRPVRTTRQKPRKPG